MDPVQENQILPNHLKEFVPFLAELNKESARGAVLICCSYLDTQLRQILRAFLVETPERDKLLEGFNAPLGTLSSRATAAYCCGLITEVEYKECNIIRKIRNEFAHSSTISFEDGLIKAKCSNLAFSAKPYNDVVVDARGQFITATVTLITRFINRPHYVGLKKLPRGTWPG